MTVYKTEVWFLVFFFFQAEDGIRDLVRSRGLGDVYKRQQIARAMSAISASTARRNHVELAFMFIFVLLYG